MNKEEILTKLSEYGLNQKEAKVYLACLELNLTKVNEIAKKTGIVRETTYGIINSLIKKGLISYVVKSGVKYFEAADPRKLKSILKEKEKLVDSIMPDLEILKKTKIIKPRIELYEGKQGLKTVMEDILQTKEKILVIASNKYIKKMFKFYFPHFVKKRVKLKIKVKLLTDEKPLTTKFLKYKHIPQFKFKTANYMYDNKLAIISLTQKEPIGLIIEDEEIVNTQRNFFNLLWRLLK